MRGRRQYSMELVRLTNIKSQQVQEYSDIEDEAKELIVFLDENNGQFAGDHDTAYALAHCQVNQDKPYKFFVVSEKCIEDKMFKHRVIINPEIIDNGIILLYGLYKFIQNYVKNRGKTT